MKLISAVLSALTLSSLEAAQSNSGLRKLGVFQGDESTERQSEATETMVNGDEPKNLDNMVKIRITNQAYQQPFGAFFVMTHNSEETPLFKIGEASSEPLAILAEDGDPSLVVEAYEDSTNANYVKAFNTGAPYFGGDTVEFLVPFNKDYPYLTIASMAINTNDCFVALNGVKLEPSAVFQVPGYDAGSEENNELCSSIPGPACDSTTGNVRSGNGEGFVHIHRGFFGVGGELSAAGYDWRNPMMRVEMMM